MLLWTTVLELQKEKGREFIRESRGEATKNLHFVNGFLFPSLVSIVCVCACWLSKMFFSVILEIVFNECSRVEHKNKFSSLTAATAIHLNGSFGLDTFSVLSTCLDWIEFCVLFIYDCLIWPENTFYDVFPSYSSFPSLDASQNGGLALPREEVLINGSGGHRGRSSSSKPSSSNSSGQGNGMMSNGRSSSKPQSSLPAHPVGQNYYHSSSVEGNGPMISDESYFTSYKTSRGNAVDPATSMDPVMVGWVEVFKLYSVCLQLNSIVHLCCFVFIHSIWLPSICVAWKHSSKVNGKDNTLNMNKLSYANVPPFVLEFSTWGKTIRVRLPCFTSGANSNGSFNEHGNFGFKLSC